MKTNNKFNVGDIIEATEESNFMYSKTNKKYNTVAQVMCADELDKSCDFSNDTKIKIIEHKFSKLIGEEFWVQSRFFRLKEKAKSTIKKKDSFVDEKKEVNFAKMIDKVIFNKPATIVLWNDGMKTTAKCKDDEVFDPEKGLILCALKKFIKSDNVMELLDFVKVDGNGTITYKDVLNKRRKEAKKAKTKIFTVDVGNKSMAEVKEELKAIRKAEEKKSKKNSKK